MKLLRRGLFILILCLLVGATSAMTADSTIGGPYLDAASAVHFVFEDWRGDGHTAYEYAQLRDGSWWNFRDKDGLTGPAAAEVQAWAQTILDMRTTSDLLPVQPAGLDLNSADDTAYTVGHTPVDFCARMLFDSGAVFETCVDERRTARSTRWSMTPSFTRPDTSRLTRPA